MNLPQLREIWIYPIKSLPGISVQEAMVELGGLCHDRRLMLVDAHGRFISQRDEVRLGSFYCQLQQDQLEVKSQSGDRLRLQLTKGDETPEALKQAPQMRVSIWRDQAEALVHAEGSAFFSAQLDREVRLVYLPEQHLRSVPNLSGSERVSFADGYPYLLTNEASLEALNQQMLQLSQELNEAASPPLSMRRFRPNFVVSGLRSWAEEELLEFRLGDVCFTMPKLCERCVVTSIEPESLKKGREPLRTLAKYHRWAGAVWFGANLMHLNDGLIVVGTAMNILKSQASPRPAVRQ